MDNIFQANLEGKWLEEAVNSMYRKYIRNEPIENRNIAKNNIGLWRCEHVQINRYRQV